LKTYGGEKKGKVARREKTEDSDITMKQPPNRNGIEIKGKTGE